MRAPAGGVLAFIAQMPHLGWGIWAAILINGVSWFWHGFKAEKASAALRRLLPGYARVMRGGAEQRIMAEQLVPGDVILLAEGDHFSAAARAHAWSAAARTPDAVGGVLKPAQERVPRVGRCGTLVFSGFPPTPRPAAGASLAAEDSMAATLTAPATALRPRQTQELDLALERERSWLVAHIRALEALQGGPIPVAPGSVVPDAPAGVLPKIHVAAPAGPAAPQVGWAAMEADVPALAALSEVLAGYLAAELAPDDMRTMLDRVYRQRLEEVDAAIDRVADGTYGACERCGCSIYVPRLKRLPWTRHCRRCAETLAREGIWRTVVPSTADATDAVMEFELAKALLH